MSSLSDQSLSKNGHQIQSSELRSHTVPDNIKPSSELGVPTTTSVNKISTTSSSSITTDIETCTSNITAAGKNNAFPDKIPTAEDDTTDKNPTASQAAQSSPKTAVDLDVSSTISSPVNTPISPYSPQQFNASPNKIPTAEDNTTDKSPAVSQATQSSQKTFIDLVASSPFSSLVYTPVSPYYSQQYDTSPDKTPTAENNTTDKSPAVSQDTPSSTKTFIDLDTSSTISSPVYTPASAFSPLQCSLPSSQTTGTSHVKSRPVSSEDTDEDHLSFETVSSKSLTYSQDSSSSSTRQPNLSAFENALMNSGSPVPSHVSETPNGSLEDDVDVDYISTSSAESTSEYNGQQD